MKTVAQGTVLCAKLAELIFVKANENRMELDKNRIILAKNKHIKGGHQIDVVTTFYTCANSTQNRPPVSCHPEQAQRVEGSIGIDRCKILRLRASPSTQDDMTDRWANNCFLISTPGNVLQ